MKQLLIETSTFKPTISPVITEGKLSARGNLVVEGILATAEIKNGNGRYYSRELWVREMKKYDELIKSNGATGELDHPESQTVNLKNVSHNIIEYRWDGDEIIGKIEILPTPSGNILKALIENNIRVGVSSRGMGSLKEEGGIMEVQDDFELLCWDFVSTPSNPNSFMKPLRENITESKYYNQYGVINSIIIDILCGNGSCPLN